VVDIDLAHRTRHSFDIRAANEQKPQSARLMPIETSLLQKCGILLPPFLAIGVLLAPNTASADQLCGRQFDSLSQLYADIRSEVNPTWRVIERPTHVIFAGGQMIWAFARDSQPSFPAVACLRVVGVDDRIEAIVQTRCEGAKAACDAVAAKANGKDWSNLFGE
jgi:hypothetical protein